jgi:hypothetical protein
MTIEQQYDAIVRYLVSCLARKDWHGVSDAANDIRVMEAKHPILEKRLVNVS